MTERQKDIAVYLAATLILAVIYKFFALDCLAAIGVYTGVKSIVLIFFHLIFDSEW